MFAKILKDSAASEKAWETRKRKGSGGLLTDLGGTRRNSAASKTGPIPRTPTQEKRHQKDLASENWHTRTMAQMKDKDDAALKFIAADAHKAARAAQSMGNSEKEGRYLDEMHYASMEMTSRQKYRAKRG